MPAHFRAWRHALRAHGATFDFDWPLFVRRAGIDHAETVRQLNAEFGDRLDPVAIVRSQHAAYDRWIPELDLIAPVVAFLDEIAGPAARRPLPVAVASGGTRAHVERTLSVVGLRERFDCVLTRADVTHGKPHPEMFLLAAKRMGVASERCVVFEDGEPGLDAARRAGMSFVRVVRTRGPDVAAGEP